MANLPFNKLLTLSLATVVTAGIASNSMALNQAPNYATQAYQSQMSGKLGQSKLGMADHSVETPATPSDQAIVDKSAASTGHHAGIYFGLGAGVAYQMNSHFYDPTGARDLNLYSKHKIAPSYNALLGYEFNFPVRLEVDYSYIGDFSYHVYPTASNGQGPVNVYGKFKTHSQVALANVYYIFMQDHKVRPFVGAGIGMAWNTLKATDTVVAGSRSHTKSNFAWDAVAGMNFVFNQHWGMNVDLRYMQLGDAAGYSAGAAYNVTSKHLSELTANAALIYQF